MSRGRGRHSIGATGRYRPHITHDAEDSSPARRIPSLISRTSSWVGAPVIVAVLPILTILVHAVSQIHRTPLEAGDYALLEMGARSALDGVQRLGPYSRFGWNHPGPATFYLSAPIYSLSGQRPEGLAVASLVANLAAIGGIVVIARRAAGTVGGWAAAAVTLFLLEVGGVVWLDHPWNPLTVVLPLAAAAVLGAGAVAGAAWTLPFVVLAASYALQTHVGTAPVLGLLAVALGPVIVWRWHRTRVEWHKPAVAAGVVFVVMWALPVLEQVTGHPGNLSVLSRFFTSHSGADHSLTEVLRVTGPELTLTRGRTFSSLSQLSSGVRMPTSSTVMLIILLSGAALGLAANVVRRRWFCAGLCVAGLAGAAGSVLAAQRVIGPLFGYLTSPALAIGVVLWLAVLATVSAELATIVRRLPERVRRATVVVVIAGLACSSVLLATRSASANLFAPARSNPRNAHLLANIRTLTSAQPDRPVFIDPQLGTRTWSLAALVANQLERDGVRVHTPRAWEFMFGPQRTATAGRSMHIRFVDVRKGSPPPPPARLLGQIKFTRAYLLPAPSGKASDPTS